MAGGPAAAVAQRAGGRAAIRAARRFLADSLRLSQPGRWPSRATAVPVIARGLATGWPYAIGCRIHAALPDLWPGVLAGRGGRVVLARGRCCGDVRRCAAAAVCVAAIGVGGPQGR